MFVKLQKQKRLSFLKAFFVYWSGWQDSNLRPPAPKAGGLRKSLIFFNPPDLFKYLFYCILKHKHNKYFFGYQPNC